MKRISVIIICIVLSACANTPAKRFEVFRDQISASPKVDVVVDSLGLNDIKGKHPGYDPELNQVFSQALQQSLVNEFGAKGYQASVLYATQGAHVDDYVDGKTIHYANRNLSTGKVWNGPELSEREAMWASESMINYFDTAFDETKFVNRKKEHKFIEFMNTPINSEKAAKHRQEHSPEAAAQRKSILENMPDVLANSTADIIFFVKAAGYEVNRAKAFGAAALLTGLSLHSSGGSSVNIWGVKSVTVMEAVAINRRNGQVVWTGTIQAGRYSDSQNQIPLLLKSYPQATG